MGASSEKYTYCNHHHELTENHEIVNFGDGDFVANKGAIPLLRALNELGIKTRSHHIEGKAGWFSILLDNVSYKEQIVNEIHANRIKYNNKNELLIFFGAFKGLKSQTPLSDLLDIDAVKIYDIIGGPSISDVAKAYQIKDLLTTNKFYTKQTNLCGITWYKIFNFLQSKGYIIL